MEDKFMASSIASDDNKDAESENLAALNMRENLGGVFSESQSLESNRGNRSRSGKVWPCDVSFEDDNHENCRDSLNEGDNTIDVNDTSFISSWENDVLVWLPPEPEDKEDDVDGRVANYDDDDDYADGTKWVSSTSSSSLSEDQGISNSYREERNKAMVEAMNGQFKFLVSRFLASEGIACSKEEDTEGWLDIVASLSWEAALLVKPVANKGKEMDPASYMKVKCIAYGSRNESEVIKGLVFKKNTAHKHMPTKFRNPRLLLLKGVLGESTAGLSSFNTMTQEKGYLKSVIDIIETCHPDIVLVEKTVSRDVQESLLKKGITLVFDMKLARLERIARCTGSEIISSSDITIKTQLKQCEYFHIEKVVEEHNQNTEGGKKSCKTLMFFEGCPKPLGCTILLRGSHSDELKKIKRVMYYTVFAAYHLILETSFFADQRAISLSVHDAATAKNLVSPTSSMDFAASSNNVNPSGSAYTVEIPDSDEDMEKPESRVKQNLDILIEGYSTDITSNGDSTTPRDFYVDGSNSNGVYQQEKSDLYLPLLPGQYLSSVSASLSKVFEEGFRLGSACSYDLISSYLGYDFQGSFQQNGQVNQETDLRINLPSLDTINSEAEIVDNFDEKKTNDQILEDVKIESVSDLNQSLENMADVNNPTDAPQKGDIGAVLDPQSILVLFSSRSILKDTICEQSHLTRIKYYGNFDMSLGRFLQDILLSQKGSCAGCAESPDSHVYSYTHQNGKLSVQVKTLPLASRLPGADEKKIWMWTRCLKCQYESGIPRPTKRVIMSTAARGLSFGKFLELSFSSHSAARRLISKCGHLLHRDCLRFFGLGSKVAMFRYSPVEIYAACKPPPLLDFTSPIRQEWVEKEAKEVREKGERLFLEVEGFLARMQPKFSRLPIKPPGSTRVLSEVEEMLRQEKAEFEMVSTCYGRLGQSPEIFDLTYLNQELLLQSYVWDCRLQLLMSQATENDALSETIKDDDSLEQSISVNGTDMGDSSGEDDKSVDSPRSITSVNIDEPAKNNHHNSNTCDASIDKEINVDEPSRDGSDDAIEFLDAAISQEVEAVSDGLSATMSSVHEGTVTNDENPIMSSSASGYDENPSRVTSPIQMIVHDGNIKTNGTSSKSQVPGRHGDSGGDPAINCSVVTVVDSSKDWIWDPFPEICKAFWKSYCNGYLRGFGFIFSYSPEYLTPLNHLAAQERQRLCYPVGPDGIVISIREEEISSLIACALVLNQEPHAEIEYDDTRSLAGEASISSFWSTTGSFGLERIQSSQSLSSTSSDELSTIASEGSLFIDRVLSSEKLHPEIHLGIEKNRSKYSVVCLYAKQFYALRRQCCPSETAYISSLSRCKKWDAQGGKSKALFAKTLDDRFIIKEINKTELASFLKFAPEYFKHVSESLKTGSQTCLAKILGIYQVKQSKGGKEFHLMVMENLLFGRNISRTYDLKGAVFSRYISDPNNPGAVLLDQNFVEDMGLAPMYVGGRTKHLLQRAIWNDTSFLTSINVMDYSLLVGVDKERRQLVFGIIDYLRQYTWDKQLETWVKASLVVPKNSLPTVISPKEYKKRFRKFMSKYFLTVPDSWTTDPCSDPSRLCTDDNSYSSQNRCMDLQDSSTHISPELLVAEV